MRYIMHDASRLIVAMLGLTINAVESSKKIVKNKLRACLYDDSVVKQEEFSVFKKMVKNISIEHAYMKKKLSEVQKDDSER